MKSFDKSSLFNFDAFALVCMDFNISWLENTSSINSIESLTEKLFWESNFTKFINLLFLWNILFELIAFFTKLSAFSYSACFFLIFKLFFFNHFCLKALLNLYSSLIKLFFYLLKVVQLLSKLSILNPSFLC